MRTCRVVTAEAQGASVIGQGSFSLTSDRFGAQALPHLWSFHFLYRLSLLPGRHTALRRSYPGLQEVRRHLNTAEWMGLFQILLIPQSTARSPFGSSVAGFSASAGRC